MKICPVCSKTFSDDLTVCPDDAGELTEHKDPLVGEVFAEHYEIISLLGKGGMSVVYKARHRLMDRIVAIKLLHGNVDDLAMARFKLEAKAASSLNHPNIITVYDFGVVNREAYLVMDCLDGTSLSDVLLQEKRIPVDRAVNIFRQTCAGLAHAHKKGIIHRDLKPANLCLIKGEDGNDHVKIVDFGIAKLIGTQAEQPTQLTLTGDVFGSPLYMSPEQCLGQPLDVRTDIYSLGCVMYECLTGIPPHLGESSFATMTRHVTVTPTAFDKIVPELHINKSIEAIVFRCLEKKREDRYQSATDILTDLPSIMDSSGSLSVKLVAHPSKQRQEIRLLRYGFWTLLVLLAALFAYMSLDYGPEHDHGTVLEKTIWNSQTTIAQSLINAQLYEPAKVILHSAEETARVRFSNRGRLLTALLLQQDLYRKARMYEELVTTNNKIAILNRQMLLDFYRAAMHEVDELAKTPVARSASNSQVTEDLNRIMAGITLVSIKRIARELMGNTLDKNAELLLTRAKTVYSNLQGSDSLSVGDIDFLLAECYYTQQQTLKVRPILAEAVSIYQKSKGMKYKNTIISTMRLGQIDRDQNDFVSAKRELEQALNAAEQYFPDDKFLLSLCMRSYADYFNQTGNREEATKLFARANSLLTNAEPASQADEP